MKKRIRQLTVKYVRRVGALFATICLSVSLMMPFASAASDTEAEMPSDADFRSHYGSWFVWRVVSNSGLSYFELCSNPVSLSNGRLDSSAPTDLYSPQLFDVSVISGSSTLYYACAFPVPLRGLTGNWSELPSFPVGTGFLPGRCFVNYYAPSSYVVPSGKIFLVPLSSSSTPVYHSSSSSSNTDSIGITTFVSPFSSYPFAFRSETSSTRSSYVVQGGYYFSPGSPLLLYSCRFLSSPSSFVVPPSGYVVSSSSVGVVVVGSPTPPSGGTINSASSFALSSVKLSFTLCVPVDMLPDVKVGDWISDSPEDLQDALTNEFGVDSGKLTDSKNSITDWSNSESIDSIASDTALGFFGGLMSSGLAPCFVVVALLCFGAIMLHILLRKALD